MKRTIGIAFLVAAATCVNAGAATISERTTYFAVRGSTLEQLDRELNRKGPTAGTSGDRHPGATQVSFGGRIAYAPDKRGCKVGRTSFTLKLNKILPRWNPPRSASGATVIVWRTLAQDIARHEADHAKIARSYVNRMESAVRNLGPRPTCKAMEAAVDATTARYLKEHEQAQRNFDLIEGREVNWRLKRLLDRNIRDAVAER
jgi:predicted secreted Zn-dependent protease